VLRDDHRQLVDRAKNRSSADEGTDLLWIGVGESDDTIQIRRSDQIANKQIARRTSTDDERALRIGALRAIKVSPPRSRNSGTESQCGSECREEEKLEDENGRRQVKAADAKVPSNEKTSGDRRPHESNRLV
jgi:hypothetical protein